MQIPRRAIDDFKTDRKGITPPLPVLFRLIPLLFYCAIGLAVVLNSLYFIQYRMAVQSRDEHIRQTASVKGQIAATQSQRVALEAQILKATDIEAWVQGARPLQPLLVAVTRSMNEKSSILDLRFDRDVASPAQIHLSLRIATDSAQQLDDSLAKIAEQKYRTFSPQQTMGRGEVDYKATLVRQEQPRDVTSGTDAARTTP